MAGETELETRLLRVEAKLDALTESVDVRFGAVDEAIAEQRQYTEFAFHQVVGRFDQVDGRFGQVDRRFDQVDGRFDQVDGRFNGLDRKLDQFIDTQSKANELVERRLNALESRRAANPDG